MDTGIVGLQIQQATTESAKGKKVNASNLLKLVESQGYRCALTGWKLSPKLASIDHIHPLSKGGSHTIENAQVVHRLVNTAKGTLSNDEFISLCIAVASFAAEKQHSQGS